MALFLHLRPQILLTSRLRACLLSLFSLVWAHFWSPLHWLVSFGLGFEPEAAWNTPFDDRPILPLKVGQKLKSFKKLSICVKCYSESIWRLLSPLLVRKLADFKAQAHLFTFAQFKYFLLPESAEIQWSFLKSPGLILWTSFKLNELHLCPRASGQSPELIIFVVVRQFHLFT